MKVSEIIRSVKDGCELDVLVSPRSNRSGPEGVDEWRRMLVLRVRAPPLDGRANKEVESYFCEVTGCKSKVTAGMTSHQKTVTISGDPKSIIEALERSLRWMTPSALNAWRRSWRGSGPLRRTT